MSINANEQKQVEQKQTRRRWPLVALFAILMYIAPTVNSILQQFIAAKWTIVISISGFQLNLVLLICEIIFTWVIMGISFLIGMFALPDAIINILSKRKMSRPVRVALTIVFPLIWIWNYLFEKWYCRNE
jgi:hypothetical protein